MLAVTATAAHKSTGAPEYFLVRALIGGNPPQIDELNPGVVYRLSDLCALIETSGPIRAFVPGARPQSLRVSLGTNGYRFVETVHQERSTGLLRKLPTFAFVREARDIDFANLYAIAEPVFEPPIRLPDELLRRYEAHGWVSMDEEGQPGLTPLGRALLSYGDAHKRSKRPPASPIRGRRNPT